jgi:glycolate oxidase
VRGRLGAGEALVADDAAGQRRLWQVRRKVGEAVKGLSPYKEADTVVPRSRLAELVAAARAAAGRQGLTAIVYGHAGDGNLHVNLLRGALDERPWHARRDAAEDELFAASSRWAVASPASQPAKSWTSRATRSAISSSVSRSGWRTMT